ncbi:MAG: sigma 54-interacting transcriptional regulator [Desulfobacteraceae bacterium]|nr:sigma 54-interacting transcriptional regulator [Desulfobacteraceae bacterium]
MGQTISSFSEEIQRLSKNSRVLFDLLPDMMFIVRDDFVIERMNRAAAEKFGNQEGESCHWVIFGLEAPCQARGCPFCPEGKDFSGQVFEVEVNEFFYVEYVHIPFEGYLNENLTLIALRDITRRKKQDIELRQYNENIEKVLSRKIQDLNKSESERERLYNELNCLKNEMERYSGEDVMIGESRPMRELREMIYQVAPSSATVLITGESGTGKELVADLIYRHSDRHDKPYFKFNCAAVTETLVESDLFGYEKGAFTGANATRKGKFEEAHGGTIFLDEIGNISPKMQSGLLRVLQEGEIVRVGGTRTISVDVRVIAATNVDLAEKVDQGMFREDLYYRLNVINLPLVPLRERKADIAQLATNFLVKYRERFNKKVTYLPTSVLEILWDHDWPGNVRELENAIQRAVLLSKDGIITPEDLGLDARGKNDRDAPPVNIEAFRDRSLKESLSILEAELLAGILRENSDTIENLCKRLGVARTTLYQKLKRYGIDPHGIKKQSSS